MFVIMHIKMTLYSIPHKLYKAIIIKRPSATCKTPYVADVYIPELDLHTMAHSPSLGCCGLADKDHEVMVHEQTNKKTVCKYVIMLSHIYDKNTNIYVGIHPKLAETLVEQALIHSKIPGLENLREIQREKKYLNSRFDFIGINENGDNFILEVKSVPLSDYDDISAKERKNKDYSEYNIYDKVAYFPDGYRKNKGALVSPRALKHIQELEEITKTTNIKTYLCYVVQREDANRFQTSILDPIYKEAVKKASESGVNIITLQMKWDAQGNCDLISNNLLTHL